MTRLSWSFHSWILNQRRSHVSISPRANVAGATPRELNRRGHQDANKRAHRPGCYGRTNSNDIKSATLAISSVNRS